VPSAVSVQLAERTWKLPREQKAVDDAIRFAELAISYCNSDCREATAMAVAELAENVLKYGAGDGGAGAGTIAIGVNHNVVRIRVQNLVSSRDDGERVMAGVTRIASAPKVMDLYRTRLQELFEQPALKRAQLGLLRIAFEGGFQLSCSYQHPQLEIVAERPCAQPE
jgi:hypothetical protein